MSSRHRSAAAAAATTLVAALACAPAAAVPISSSGGGSTSGWTCTSVSFSGAPAPYACQGSFAPAGGNNDSIQTVENLHFALPSAPTSPLDIIASYKDNDVSASGTTAAGKINFTAGGNGAGSVRFDAAVTVPFVMVLKFGQEWSAYAFNSPVAAGTVWNFSGGPSTGGGLSHGSLYIAQGDPLVPPTVNAAPEPEGVALMLAALAGVAAASRVARRRLRLPVAVE